MSTTSFGRQKVAVSSPLDLVAAVRQAHASRIPLVDYGIAHAGLGHAPPAVHMKLTQAADPANGGILEHYVRDLTVRAAAGITIGDLQRALAPHNQFAPIDADDDITLGEAIHHNTYGPLRVGYGSLRDILLGLHYIDGDGRDIHVGGRTVKNVAGYDLSRFLVGSLGELGIVHEATFRTYAIPEHVFVAEIAMADPAAFDAVATDLLLSDAKPAHLSYVFRADRPWLMRLAYFGNQRGCDVQLRAMEAFTQRIADASLLGSFGMTLEEDAIQRAAQRSWRRGATAVVKVIVPPASTGMMCNALAAWYAAQPGKPPPEKGPWKEPLMPPVFEVEALPMHGCIFTGGQLEPAEAVRLDETINHTISSLNGLRVWHARPGGAESIDPFGAPQPDWPVLAKLKRTMDPHGIFNPGRLLR